MAAEYNLINVVLSQITVDNSQPSSLHYDSAGMTAVPHHDLCVALIIHPLPSGQASVETEESWTLRSMLWIVPEFHFIAQNDPKMDFRLSVILYSRIPVFCG